MLLTYYYYSGVKKFIHTDMFIKIDLKIALKI